MTDYALTLPEVSKIANSNGHTTDVLTYSALQRLPPEGRNLILLCRSNPTYGHFVAVLNRGPRQGIEFFDSYGRMPDRTLDAIEKLNPNINSKLNQRDQLSSMLYQALDDGYPIRYSEFKYQDPTGTAQYCGRIAALRCLHSNLDEYQFHQLLKKESRQRGGSIPQAIIGLTQPLLD